VSRSDAGAAAASAYSSIMLSFTPIQPPDMECRLKPNSPTRLASLTPWDKRQAQTNTRTRDIRSFSHDL